MIFIHFLIACTSTNDRIVEPSFIVVEVDGELGTADAPLPFCHQSEYCSAPHTNSLQIRTLDRNSEPYPMNGEVKFDVRPGKISSDRSEFITLENGEWRGDISFTVPFGPTRIWIADEGDKDINSSRQASFATGLSETLYFHQPTIRELSNTFDRFQSEEEINAIERPQTYTTTNHLAGEFTEVRATDREIAVTSVGTAGFWVTDLSDEPGTYNSMYVYNFSKPKGVYPGARLSKLTGGNQEYLGSTQLSFPDYEVEEEIRLVLPEAPTLTGEQLCNDALMEGFESAKITINEPTVADLSSPNYAEELTDYLEYGQWPIMVGDCKDRIFIDSSALTYNFDPVIYDGKVNSLTGIVSQVWSKWVILIVEDEEFDIDNPSQFSARPSPRTVRRPLPRARQ